MDLNELYKEIEKAEVDLNAKRLKYIKEALVENGGSIKLKFKEFKEFKETNDAFDFDDQFPVIIEIAGIPMYLTEVYVKKNDFRIVLLDYDDMTLGDYDNTGENAGLTDEECEEIYKIQDMERLNFETLFRIVRWDYNRCFKDESLDKDLFVEKYGRVMGEHYYNKFVHEFDGNILKMVGYFRGSEKEGQVFCDMITERIEKYEQRESYNRSKLNN